VIGDAIAAHQTIYDVFEDANHVIWILSNNGLSKAHGRVPTGAHQQGIPPSVRGAMISDGRGELWLNTDTGLLRLTQEAFEAAVEDPTRQLQYQLYDTADGVAGRPGVKLLARRDATGRLWFLRGGVLTSVMPSRLTDTLSAEVPQVVRIESVATNDGTHDLSQSVLPSTTRRIEINYTTLTLTAPNKIRFRYRLDGFTEIGWTGTQRQALSQSGAGLVCVSRRSDGQRQALARPSAAWAPAGATFVRLVRLRRLGCAARPHRGRDLAAAVQHDQRVRGCADGAITPEPWIHDTLLQNLVGLSLQFDALAGSLSALPPMGDRLVRIESRSRVCAGAPVRLRLRSASPPGGPDQRRRWLSSALAPLADCIRGAGRGRGAGILISSGGP
jgi:hypothetical protein